MKKIKAFSAAILIVFCLTSCASSSVDSSTDDTAQTPTAPAVNMSTLNLNVIVPATGLVDQLIACNDSGFFETVMSTHGYANLYYYDNESHTKKLITASDGSPFISDAVGGVSPVAANEKVFVFKRGHVPDKYVKYDGTPSYLICADADGGNRKELYLEENQLFDSTGGVVAGGSMLYFMRHDYNLDGNGYEPTVEKTYLCRADFETGEISELCEFDPDPKMTVMGVWGDCIVFQSILEPPEDMTFDEYRNSISHAMYLYDVANNSLIDAGISWKNGEMTCTVDDSGGFYCIKAGSAALERIDLLSGETTTVCDNVNIAGEGFEASVYGMIFDSHVPVTLSASGKDSVRLAVDIETGEISELKLQCTDSDGWERPVTVAGKCGDCFIVICGSEYTPVTDTFADGTVYSYEAQSYVFAAVDKADYYGSIANYTYFE